MIKNLFILEFFKPIFSSKTNVLQIKHRFQLVTLILAQNLPSSKLSPKLSKNVTIQIFSEIAFCVPKFTASENCTIISRRYIIEFELLTSGIGSSCCSISATLRKFYFLAILHYFYTDHMHEIFSMQLMKYSLQLLERCVLGPCVLTTVTFNDASRNLFCPTCFFSFHGI